jgi:hypothetical protein
MCYLRGVVCRNYIAHDSIAHKPSALPGPAVDVHHGGVADPLLPRVVVGLADEMGEVAPTVGGGAARVGGGQGFWILDPPRRRYSGKGPARAPIGASLCIDSYRIDN